METSSRFTYNQWGCSSFTPRGAYSLYSIVWNSWMSQIFFSNWFERCFLFCAFGGGKSISICLWRPCAASFSVNLDSFAPGISWQSSFGQSLSRDLQNFNSSEAVVLQYVDDILLCAETEEACLWASEDFLNFLAGCSYKASRERLSFVNNLLDIWA